MRNDLKKLFFACGCVTLISVCVLITVGGLGAGWFFRDNIKAVLAAKPEMTAVPTSAPVATETPALTLIPSATATRTPTATSVPTVRPTATPAQDLVATSVVATVQAMMTATASVTTTVDAKGCFVIAQFGMDPQRQIGHPPFYIETGISGTQKYCVEVPANGVVIVGGTDVDGKAGGVYRAYPKGASVKVTVTNGFLLVTLDEWARDEFCFRIGHAKQYGWVYSTVKPLDGWKSCP